MKSRKLNLCIFIMSIICLAVSLVFFWNIGVYSDEFNTSPDIMLGGSAYLYMAWIQLGVTALICIFSGINLIIKK